ncbi:hypothetical protein EI42_01874 [Thermosporothrix hazakensis]|uniref:Uncharacterized protein n=1 Tax=Thermosporothrix hazakensis TaxID=644383 RepID=A0A326UAE4_THEHA|nr:hypothetical protein [Thermosporothrix hazakensis]PZW32782.1 hypothetical protein EI42_01874 [Thermosporothrix hazakensis]
MRKNRTPRREMGTDELPRMLAPSVSVQLTGQILHTDFPQRAERTCEQLVKSKSGVVSSDSPEMLQYGLSKLDCNYLLVAFH